MDLNQVPWPLVAGFALFGLIWSAKRGADRKISDLRRIGLYPNEGTGSDEDVRRLCEQGEKIAAIKLYREIHGCGLKESKEAVEKLARSE